MFALAFAFAFAFAFALAFAFAIAFAFAFAFAFCVGSFACLLFHFVVVVFLLLIPSILFFGPIFLTSLTPYTHTYIH